MKMFYLICLLFCLSFVNAEFIFDRTINGTGPDYLNERNVFNSPISIWVDENYLYVSDSSDSFVVLIDNDDEIYRKLGDSARIENQLYSPKSIFLMDEKIYICTPDGIKIYEKRPHLNTFSRDLSFYTNPYGMTFFNNKFYITDSRNSRIYIHNDDESYDETYINLGRFSGQLDTPTAITSFGDYLYIVDSGNNRIQVFDSDLNFVRDIGKGKGGINLKNPRGLFVNEEFIFAADTGNNRIVVFDIFGEPLEILNETEEEYRFFNPSDIFYYDKKVYIADTGNRRVQVYDFNFTAPRTLAKERLDLLKFKYNEINEIEEMIKYLDINFKTDLKKYYNDANFFFLELSYSKAEASLDLFEEEYEIKIKELDYTLDDEIPQVISELRNIIKIHSDSFDFFEEIKELNQAENLYENKNYIESLEILFAVKKSIYSNDLPDEILEEDNELELRIIGNKAELNNFKNLAELYKQEIDFTYLENILQVADSYYEILDFENTEQTLDTFDNQFNNLYNSFNQQKLLIDEALDLIREAEELENPVFELNIQRAKTIVYDDPEEAKKIINKVLDKSSGNTLIFGLFVLILFIILAIFLATKLINKTRKR